jgi:hypothetical protein
MARGKRAGNDNFVAMIAGGVSAVLLDYMWSSSKLFGYNDAIGYVTSKAGRKVKVTGADYGQLGLSTVLGAYGFLRGGSGSRIPAFAYGMGITQIITKFVFPAANVPRYVVYDIDPSGALRPVGTFQ